MLRTRISHPPNRSTYAPSMWSHILRDQLGVSEAEFWACVRDGVIPERSRPSEPSGDPVPAEVVGLLLSRVGMSEAEVQAMSREDAIERLNTYWSAGR